jgi:hypothetical protein
MRAKLDHSRFRNAADKGETRDKVAAPDPAAAPDPTDAEASGSRQPGTAMDRSVEAQRRQRVSDVPRSDHTTPGRGQSQIPARRSAWLMGVGLAAAGLLGIAAAYLFAP